jgi:hypothetical protein
MENAEISAGELLVKNYKRCVLRQTQVVSMNDSECSKHRNHWFVSL